MVSEAWRSWTPLLQQSNYGLSCLDSADNTWPSVGVGEFNVKQDLVAALIGNSGRCIV